MVKIACGVEDSENEDNGKLSLKFIDLCDSTRKAKNDVAEIAVKKKPGIFKDSDGNVIISPAQVIGETATLLINGTEFLNFLEIQELCLPSKVNNDERELQMIGQRTPTKARTESILKGLKSDRIPRNHVITVKLAVFGAEVNSFGQIVLNQSQKPSTVCIVDAGGRISAIMKNYNDCLENDDTHVLIEKSIAIQLNIDFSGEREKFLKEFLTHNRDAKKVSVGTLQSVEISQLTHMSKAEISKIDYENDNWLSYVARELYSNPISGTILELFPWKNESGESTHSEFRGKGSSGSLRTALKSVASEFKRSGNTVQELPIVLSKAFRVFFKESPKAVKDAHDAVEVKGYKSKFRLHSGLAIKVMLLFFTKMWKHSKDEKEFLELINGAIHRYYKNAPGDWTNKMLKKPQLDQLWTDNSWFNGPGFNSGAKATINMLNALTVACNQTLESVGKSGMSDIKKSQLVQ